MTEDLIYNAAIAQGMPRNMALLILAQSKHESGNYGSAIFNDCNNSFGYKNPSSIGFSACSLHPDYVGYDNVQSSTIEVCNWIKRRQADGSFPADLTTIQAPEAYADLLFDAGYFDGALEDYVNGLVNWYNANFVPATIAGGAILIAAVVGYFLLRKKRNRAS